MVQPLMCDSCPKSRSGNDIKRRLYRLLLYFRGRASRERVRWLCVRCLLNSAFTKEISLRLLSLTQKTEQERGRGNHKLCALLFSLLGLRSLCRHGLVAFTFALGLLCFRRRFQLPPSTTRRDRPLAGHSWRNFTLFNQSRHKAPRDLP